MTQKRTKKVNKVGRPTKYSAEKIDKVHEFVKMRLGKKEIPTVEGFAVFVDVCRDTVYEWMRKHKKFSYTIGKMMSLQADMLQIQGIKGIYNPTITTLLLKNNHGFKDKHEIDHTTKGKEMPAPILGGVNTDVHTDYSDTKDKAANPKD